MIWMTRERRLLWPQLGWNEAAEWDTGASLSNERQLRWTWYSTGGMDTLAGGTRWSYPGGPGAAPSADAEYLPLRDHLGSTVLLMTATRTGDLAQFYGAPASNAAQEGFGLRIAESFDYDPYGWPTVHAPSGSPAKFGDPVVGLLAIRSGQVGALEGTTTSAPLLSGRELWQWYTNTPGNDPILTESETTRAPQSTAGWRHLYTARPWDAQTRSFNNRHRWYDPHQARFLSRDPIGYGDGLLQYAYVGGDPIGRVDPLGLAWWGPFWWPDYDSPDYGPKIIPRRREEIVCQHDSGYYGRPSWFGSANECGRWINRQVRFIFFQPVRILHHLQKTCNKVLFSPSYYGSCGDAVYKVNEDYDDDPNFRIRMITAISPDGYEHTAAIFEPIGVPPGNTAILDHWFVVDVYKGIADDFGYWKDRVPPNAEIAFDEFESEDRWVYE